MNFHNLPGLTCFIHHLHPMILFWLRSNITDVLFCSLRNIIHGSDTLENAKTEIDLWFKAEEFVSYTPCAQAWLYE